MGSSMDEIQHRLQEVLVQLGNEITIFERLMYKNTNQHRRALYFRRLLQVRRDLRLLQSAEVKALAQQSAHVLRKKCEENVPLNAFHAGKMIPDSAKVTALRRRLFGVARLLVKMSEPLLCASLLVAGLLGQTFFMPFALTAFSALARFRVLSLQVLHDIVQIFNMVSALQFEEYVCLNDTVKGSFRLDMRVEAGRSKEMPDSLVCRWEGGKVLLCGEFTHTLEGKTNGDVTQDPVEDHKNETCNIFSMLQPGPISPGNKGTNTAALGKSAEGCLQSTDLTIGDDISCCNKAASTLNASITHGQVASIRKDNEVEEHAENTTDVCATDKQTQCTWHVADSSQATGTRDVYDVQDNESNVSISGTKRKVAYISVDINPGQKIEERLDKPNEGSAGSQTQNKDSLFNMLIGMRESQYDAFSEALFINEGSH